MFLSPLRKRHRPGEECGSPLQCLCPRVNQKLVLGPEVRWEVMHRYFVAVLKLSFQVSGEYLSFDNFLHLLHFK